MISGKMGDENLKAASGIPVEVGQHRRWFDGEARATSRSGCFATVFRSCPAPLNIYSGTLDIDKAISDRTTYWRARC